MQQIREEAVAIFRTKGVNHAQDDFLGYADNILAAASKESPRTNRCCVVPTSDTVESHAKELL